MGHRPQKTLLHPAGRLRPLPGDFPDEDAVGPLGQLLRQRVGEQCGPLVLHDLRSRPKTAVGPLVTALVAGHALHDLLPQRP